MSVSTMKKLTVLAYRGDADTIVRKLMGMRCVEIRQTEIDGQPIPLTFVNRDAERARAESRLHTVTDALNALRKYAKRQKGLGGNLSRVDRDAFARDGRGDAAWQLAGKAVETRNRMEELRAERTRCEAKRDALYPWLDYDVPLNVAGSGKTELILGTYPAKAEFQAVGEELTEAGAFVEEINADENGRYVAVTCHVSDAEEISRLLAVGGFVRASFKEYAGTAKEEYDRTETELNRIGAEESALDEILRELACEIPQIEILSDIEETNLNAAKQMQKLAETKNCTLLTGWLPVFTKDAVEDLLYKYDCAYEITDPEEGEEPPVMLRNNRFAVNFEWVLGMYAYPKYGAFDPTFIMSIFYFLIFGLMFADVGYGLLLLVGCFAAVRFLHPKPGLKRMLLMFGYCGISSIAMGLVFGGWFGDLPTAIMQNMLHLPIDSEVGHFFGSGLWFNPLDDPMTFLVLSLGVGFVHLVTGMVVNFVVMCRRGQAVRALCDIATYWVLFAGLVMIVLGLLGEAYAGVAAVGKYVAIAGTACILLFKGVGQKNVFSWILKGFGGLYGLISYASDLLSYSRILALGLVAGVIAKVINLITMLGASGPFGFLMMLIILIAGHGLNLAINVLGTFVHTSRLQYIEFFGKFYEDGGKPFEPATEANKYSENISETN